MATYTDAQMAVSYNGDTQKRDAVPLQERLNALTNVLAQVMATLDGIEGVGLKVNTIGGCSLSVGPGTPPTPMLGACSLAEQAVEMADSIDQRVRLLGGRIGRL